MKWDVDGDRSRHPQWSSKCRSGQLLDPRHWRQVNCEASKSGWARYGRSKLTEACPGRGKRSRAGLVFAGRRSRLQCPARGEPWCWRRRRGLKKGVGGSRKVARMRSNGPVAIEPMSSGSSRQFAQHRMQVHRQRIRLVAVERDAGMARPARYCEFAVEVPTSGTYRQTLESRATRPFVMLGSTSMSRNIAEDRAVVAPPWRATGPFGPNKVRASRHHRPCSRSILR